MPGEMVTVRADFYPNGEIIPLGITYTEGNSRYIDKVIKVEKNITKKETRFYCLSNGLPIELVFNIRGWHIE